jgi:hypothetical protein
LGLSCATNMPTPGREVQAERPGTTELAAPASNLC